MDLVDIRIDNYRSIRSLRLPFDRVNLFLGETGAGKTNLYRAVELMAAATYVVHRRVGR